MEKDFQTSFIPKKPMMEERVVASRPISLLTVLSIFILFTILIATGGLYFYKGIMAKNLTTMQASLQAAKARNEPSKISQLEELDKRLTAANQILANHISISPIFEALEMVTMKTVRYTKFAYKGPGDNNGKVEVDISGVADGYRSIALQADLFTKDKSLIDPVFSNLALDDKGNVTFELTFTVNASFVNYKQVLATETSGNPTDNVTSNTQ